MNITLHELKSIHPNDLHQISNQERETIEFWRDYLTQPLIERLWMPYTDEPQTFGIGWDNYCNIKHVMGLHLSLSEPSHENVFRFLLYFDHVSNNLQKAYIPYVTDCLNNAFRQRNSELLNSFGITLAESENLRYWVYDNIIFNFQPEDKDLVFGVDGSMHVRYEDIKEYSKAYPRNGLHELFAKVYPYTSLEDPILLNDIQEYQSLVTSESVEIAAKNSVKKEQYSIEDLNRLVGKANGLVKLTYLYILGTTEARAMVEQFGIHIIHNENSRLSEEYLHL